MYSQIRILVFLQVIVLAFGQNLSCYECVPSSTQKCESLDDNSVATPCNFDTNTDGIMLTKQVHDMMNLNSNGSSHEPPFCYALHFNAGENSEQTGYYRGCSKKNPSVANFCEMLSEKMKVSGNLEKCKICNTDKCNSETFVQKDGKRLAAASDISCYDCGPEDSCLTPKDDNVKSTNCELDYEEKNGKNTALDFECFTFYINGTIDEGSFKTGVYRGCIEKNSTTDSTCDLIRKKYHQSPITECDSCSSSLCNEQTPKSYTDNEGNSSAATTLSIFCIFSIILMFYLM